MLLWWSVCVCFSSFPSICLHLLIIPTRYYLFIYRFLDYQFPLFMHFPPQIPAAPLTNIILLSISLSLSHCVSNFPSVQPPPAATPLAIPLPNCPQIDSACPGFILLFALVGEVRRLCRGCWVFSRSTGGAADVPQQHAAAGPVSLT